MYVESPAIILVPIMLLLKLRLVQGRYVVVVWPDSLLRQTTSCSDRLVTSCCSCSVA